MIMQTPWVAPPGGGVAVGRDASSFPREMQQNPSPSKTAAPVFSSRLCYFCVTLLVKNNPCQHEGSYLGRPCLSLFGKSSSLRQLLQTNLLKTDFCKNHQCPRLVHSPGGMLVAVHLARPGVTSERGQGHECPSEIVWGTSRCPGHQFVAF